MKDLKFFKIYFVIYPHSNIETRKTFHNLEVETSSHVAVPKNGVGQRDLNSLAILAKGFPEQIGINRFSFKSVENIDDLILAPKGW